MPANSTQRELFGRSSNGADGAAGVPGLRLAIALDLALGGFRFEWSQPDTAELVAQGLLWPTKLIVVGWFALDWQFLWRGQAEQDHVNRAPASVHAFLRRVRKRLPLADRPVIIGIVPDTDLGDLKAGQFHELDVPPDQDPLKWLATPVREFIRVLETLPRRPEDTPQSRGHQALSILVGRRLFGLSPAMMPGLGLPPGTLRLQVTFDVAGKCLRFEWTDGVARVPVAHGRITCTGGDELTWELTADGPPIAVRSTHHLNGIRSALQRWIAQFPVAPASFSARWAHRGPGRSQVAYQDVPSFAAEESPWPWLADQIQEMAWALRFEFSPLGRLVADVGPEAISDFARQEARLLRREQKRLQEEQQRRDTMARLAAERRQREQQKAEARKAAAPATSKPAPSPATAPKERAPLPPVPVRVELPDLTLQDTVFPLEDLRGYFLRERAARWWVSNQSDDLLALPYCRIERLDYQVRTALRVLGPLRGRALLSDEVGLGKTIEAGLVLKELLTRGLVKRFLVLTVPSLVDQWEEELSDKFGLATVTTNQAAARSDPAQFWQDHPALVASLHTLKQPAHLAVARTVKWDLLIVDEAHYLRNQTSQAWQAVNALPRQFLLLLTATPVQNSLEELYNLVTLLQPGQLPSPKEFRARFLDPKRPRQPREPEELRRLLGQVMIRNTRANAGLKLPPRRAETVLFEPDAEERTFWQEWETELRAGLAQLPASQTSLWGRLLLQAAGSSPAAWRHALEKYPDGAAARRWRERAPLETSWRKKCDLLPPLARGEGGLVGFTQFLHTQGALADALRAAGIETFVINGATPAGQRQPITEAFRKQGGALLLTHSGTEGRNLQFCHRLVNFDLPWNPMEIEQRIGRLHRLGQRQPVQIYNLVQAGTLQEHLLQILQEKLNLFELVVGETGLVLGERFSSDEFAEEVLRRWRDSEGRVAEALASLGEELAAARDGYQQVKQLDETLFAHDYESL